MPLTHQPMDPFRKELPGMLPEPLHHCSLDIFVHNGPNVAEHLKGFS
jgi:hypothetical protein